MPPTITAKSKVPEVRAAAGLNEMQWRHFKEGTKRAYVRLKERNPTVSAWRDLSYSEQERVQQEVLEYLQEKQVVGHTVDWKAIEWRMIPLFREQAREKKIKEEESTGIPEQSSSTQLQEPGQPSASDQPEPTEPPSDSASEQPSAAETSPSIRTPSRPYDPIRDL